MVQERFIRFDLRNLWLCFIAITVTLSFLLVGDNFDTYIDVGIVRTLM